MGRMAYAALDRAIQQGETSPVQRHRRQVAAVQPRSRREPLRRRAHIQGPLRNRRAGLGPLIRRRLDAHLHSEILRRCRHFRLPKKPKAHQHVVHQGQVCVWWQKQALALLERHAGDHPTRLQYHMQLWQLLGQQPQHDGHVVRDKTQASASQDQVRDVGTNQRIDYQGEECPAQLTPMLPTSSAFKAIAVRRSRDNSETNRRMDPSTAIIAITL